jgi:plastocyanin
LQFSTAAGGRRKLASIAIAGALAFGVAACGDDDEDEGADSSETAEEIESSKEVTVTATEYEFDLSATPTAATESIEFVNDGKEPHVMIWAQLAEGVTVEEAIAAQGEKGTATLVAQTDAGPGETSSVAVDKEVAPGPYVMLCPIEGKEGAHYELGQLEEFDVE